MTTAPPPPGDDRGPAGRAPIGDLRTSVADILGPGRQLPPVDDAGRAAAAVGTGPGRAGRPSEAGGRRAGPAQGGGRPRSGGRPPTPAGPRHRPTQDAGPDPRRRPWPRAPGGRAPRRPGPPSPSTARRPAAATCGPASPAPPCATSTGCSGGSTAPARAATPAAQAAARPLADEVAQAEARLAARAAAVPRITYPDLPVSARRDDILAAVRDSQVVVLAGETGSGKTTQLPKIALELGRGVRGLIGHTQPRRLAARTVAERIAEELGEPARADRRLQGPLHRHQQRPHAGPADDRRHPAGRGAARPDAARLRHDHRRRGPRAVAQHRLPARLPRAAAPPAPRPQARSSPRRPSRPSGSAGTSAARPSSR